jgi:hypothetical protein
VQFERGQAGFDDDEVLKVKDAFEVLQRHVEKEADAARQRLQEPDVRHRRGQLDVAHAVAPHLRQGDFDAAFLADDAAVFHPLVLAAQAFVVLDRPEDAGAEQPVALRLERPVVDRLGLLDLAVRPGADALRAGDRDADLIEALRPRHLPEDVHQFIHRNPPPQSACDSKTRSFSARSDAALKSSWPGLSRTSTKPAIREKGARGCPAQGRA